MTGAAAAAGRAVGVLLALAVIAGIAAVSIRGIDRFDLPFLEPAEFCTATADGRSVDVTLEQAENAALIAAVAVGRGLPARAATIALATAYQESDLRNLDHGDRDSLGLFQQRPSQGWGTPEQVQDPLYAAHAFYDALEKVRGYGSMEITEAAQAVQRSAFPGAYADHEADARVLASALTGNSPRGFACRVDDDAEWSSPDLTAAGLTPRADAVRLDLARVFGDLSLGGFEPGGVSTGHMEGSAHYDGRAIDVFVRPIDAANRKRGWAIAHYLMAMAKRLDVATLIFDGRVWKAGQDERWRPYDPPRASADPATRAILEHRDHVHVDVFR